MPRIKRSKAPPSPAAPEGSYESTSDDESITLTKEAVGADDMDQTDTSASDVSAPPSPEQHPVHRQCEEGSTPPKAPADEEAEVLRLKQVAAPPTSPPTMPPATSHGAKEVQHKPLEEDMRAASTDQKHGEKPKGAKTKGTQSKGGDSSASLATPSTFVSITGDTPSSEMKQEPKSPKSRKPSKKGKESKGKKVGKESGKDSSDSFHHRSHFKGLHMKAIWLDFNDGDDANDGATKETAVRTIERARKLAGSDYEQRCSRGVRFVLKPSDVKTYGCGRDFCGKCQSVSHIKFCPKCRHSHGIGKRVCNFCDHAFVLTKRKKKNESEEEEEEQTQVVESPREKQSEVEKVSRSVTPSSQVAPTPQSRPTYFPYHHLSQADAAYQPQMMFYPYAPPGFPPGAMPPQAPYYGQRIDAAPPMAFATPVPHALHAQHGYSSYAQAHTTTPMTAAAQATHSAPRSMVLPAGGESGPSARSGHAQTAKATSSTHPQHLPTAHKHVPVSTSHYSSQSQQTRPPTSPPLPPPPPYKAPPPPTAADIVAQLTSPHPIPALPTDMYQGALAAHATQEGDLKAEAEEQTDASVTARHNSKRKGSSDKAVDGSAGEDDGEPDAKAAKKVTKLDGSAQEEESDGGKEGDKCEKLGESKKEGGVDEELDVASNGSNEHGTTVAMQALYRWEDLKTKSISQLERLAGDAVASGSLINLACVLAQIAEREAEVSKQAQQLLLAAVGNGCIGMVDFMLRSTLFNVNTCNSSGTTALQLAFKKEDRGMLALLLAFNPSGVDELVAARAAEEQSQGAARKQLEASSKGRVEKCKADVKGDAGKNTTAMDQELDTEEEKVDVDVDEDAVGVGVDRSIGTESGAQESTKGTKCNEFADKVAASTESRSADEECEDAGDDEEGERSSDRKREGADDARRLPQPISLSDFYEGQNVVWTKAGSAKATPLLAKITSITLIPRKVPKMSVQAIVPQPNLKLLKGDPFQQFQARPSHLRVFDVTAVGLICPFVEVSSFEEDASPAQKDTDVPVAQVETFSLPEARSHLSLVLNSGHHAVQFSRLSLPFPTLAQSLLRLDLDKMGDNHLVKLPAKPTVAHIIQKVFQTAESDERASTAAYGLLSLFNSALPSQLLFPSERKQFSAVYHAAPTTPMSSIFGATHLLRLISILPELLTAAGTTIPDAAIVIEDAKTLVDTLIQHPEWFTNCHVPACESP
eukprot:m.104150 g.104150  ORF g.104150 m.104150 type:complete len:1209 (+) comp13254_c0_seq1:40-3666(+)